MAKMTCDTIETMLASVQDEVEGPELNFKLRTARQLLMVCKEENETFRSTLEEADLDEDTRRRLTDLGYLES